ncbi:MAG TPA: hypothetical protein VIV60_33700, partial [Polyangiaceae bacterium]
GGSVAPDSNDVKNSGGTSGNSQVGGSTATGGTTSTSTADNSSTQRSGPCVGGLMPCPIGGTLMCTDNNVDQQNCGKCGNICRSGEQCRNGACSCPTGTIACGSDGCKDNLTDPNHCGICGNVCSPETPYCTEGKCSPTCDLPFKICGDRCLNATRYRESCGNCNSLCSGACGNGLCIL